MKVTDFGATVKGDETKLYTLTNKNGMEIAVSDHLSGKRQESFRRRYEGYHLQAAEACRAVQHRGECISGSLFS
mgnify:CR=1 FL=1